MKDATIIIHFDLEIFLQCLLDENDDSCDNDIYSMIFVYASMLMELRLVRSYSFANMNQMHVVRNSNRPLSFQKPRQDSTTEDRTKVFILLIIQNRDYCFDYEAFQEWFS